MYVARRGYDIYQLYVVGEKNIDRMTLSVCVLFCRHDMQSINNVVDGVGKFRDTQMYYY